VIRRPAGDEWASMSELPRPRTIDVAGGGTVGYYEYGAADGCPVLALHGTPACGAGFAWADEPARAGGIRLLAPDRPGVGLSSPLDGWRVADQPAVIAAFADALGLGRFGVWGYSGGGPYAVACACSALLADRLTGVAVAAGMGEIGAWATLDDFEKTDRQLLAMAVRRPRLARLLLRVGATAARLSPRSALRSFEGQLSSGDQATLAGLGEPRQVMALFTEAFTRGARGVVADYAALARPWGVDLDGATLPVTVWHGDDDRMVPLRHGEALADRLPDAELTVWPGAGHLGPITHVGAILDTFA
jgi:pimeloyl-ACP methyl ester carboxylesterase